MFLNEKDLRFSLEQKKLLRRVTDCIRSTEDLQEIFTATVVEVRLFLGTDRVKLYKFHADGSTQVIAESIKDNRLPSLLGLNFPADDIPPHTREMLIKSRMRTIVNLVNANTQHIGYSPLSDPETGEIISSDIRYRPVDPCHAQYLTAMGVKSSLVVPIFYYEKLWGLLVSHHCEPRSCVEDEIEAVQIVVDQISIAIAQNFFLTQAREKATREAIINQITNLLHSLPTIELQPALEAAVAAFSGSGGRLCVKLQNCLTTDDDNLKVYACGSQPVIPAIEQDSIWQEHYKSSESDVWAIPDIYQTPGLEHLQDTFQATKIRGILMIQLQHRQQILGYLSIFRQEVDTETLWVSKFDPDQLQQFPRQPFEVRQETKKVLSSKWTVAEIELAQELGKQFAIALHEYEQYQQLQTLNTNLENQLQKRTIELQQVKEQQVSSLVQTQQQAIDLQKTAAQQQFLSEVVAQICSCKDIDTIFQKTSQDICQLLLVEQVAVYHFYTDWSGEFVHHFQLNLPDRESRLQLGSKTIWNDTYLQETQGGRYRHNETLAVNDIYDVGNSAFHIEFLEQFGIKAYAIAPIFVKEKLWGLLAAYQHSQPRHWISSEIQFLSQTATLLGVAIQQTELLDQTLQQKIDLQKAAVQERVLLKVLNKLRKSVELPRRDFSSAEF